MRKFRPPDIGSLECERFCSAESATIEPKTRENAELRLLPDRSRPKKPRITSDAPSFRRIGKTPQIQGVCQEV